MTEVGERYGRLMVLAPAEESGGHQRWLCQCDCGNQPIVWQVAFDKGVAVSCGCHKREVVKERWEEFQKDGKGFWARVDSSGGEDACWPWTGNLTAANYGRTSYRGKHYRAHRLAYLLTYGKLDKNVALRHTCDNKLCCNPKHLVPGTQLENIQDMVDRGLLVGRQKTKGFWDRVDKTGGEDACWPWIGNRSNSKRFTTTYKGRRIAAYRVAYFLTRGDLDDNVPVRHTCGNKRCCNPRHLGAGPIVDLDTAKDEQGKKPGTTAKAEVGKRYGRLVVVAPAEKRGSHKRWVCQCDCGNQIVAWQISLRRGTTTSCGCRKRETTKKRWEEFQKNGKGFWARVDSSGGKDACWPWLGPLSTQGYGLTSYKGKPYRAHRLAYLLTHGKLNKNAVLRHTCDNQPCCNPRHLLPGTQLENIQDLVDRRVLKKGGKNKGSRNGRAKLNYAAAEEIRRLYGQGLSQVEIAGLFDVSQNAVSQVITGKRYAEPD